MKDRLLTPEGMYHYYLNEPAHLEFASDGICRMTGYTRTEFEDVVGDHYEKLIPEEEQSVFADFLRELENVPGIRTAEYHIKRKDGSLIYVSDTMESFVDKQGVMAGYSSVTDITTLSQKTESIQRERICSVVQDDKSKAGDIEEQLRKNEEIHDAACKFAGLWTFSYDIDAGVVYPNKLLQASFRLPARMEGYPESFLDYHYVLPEYEQEYRDAVSRIQNGEPQVEIVIQMAYPDGMRHWVRIRINRLMMNGTVGRLAVGTALPADQEKALEARIEVERRRMSVADTSLLRYVVINVTRNQVVEHSTMRDDIAQSQTGMTIEQLLASVEKHAYKDENWEKYREYINRERLISLYNEGITTLNIEGKHRTDNGSLMWVNNVLRLLCDPASGDLYVYEYTYDIHKQKLQEEILRAAVNFDYERISSLSLKSGELTRVFNEKEKQDVFIKTDNYQEAYREYCNRFVLPEEREQFIRMFSVEQMKKDLQEHAVYEITHKVKVGDEIRVKRTRFTMYDEQNQMVLMTRSDVTELVREEESKRLELQKNNEEKTWLLQERERLYAALYNLIPMVISVNLTQNRYEMMNYDKFFSKFAEESGKFDNLIKVGAGTIPEEGDRRLFVETFSRESLMKAYERGEKKVTLEHHQIGNDGKIYWAETTVIFVKNDLDEDLYEITLAQDVTERKRQEQNLQTALEAAEAANLAKGEFLSRMSHEIRTPMNAIIGMTAIAKENSADFSQVTECLDKIAVSSNYLLKLINDILEMNRIESECTEVEHTEFDFEYMMNGIRTMVETLALEAELRFDFINKVTDDTHYLGDMMRIQQILVNLITNSIKFTRSGGRVRFAAEITSQTEQEAHFCFTIADTGIGMSEKFMERMFQPFTQEDSKTTSQYSGSGLGLAIAKNLVQAMGGSIHAESMVGVGTTFVVELSIDKMTESQADLIDAIIVKEVDEKILEGIHVLMAEDHPLNVVVATKILQKRGVIVTVAENGRIAVDTFEKSEQGAFDAILMDIRMPEMDGLDATKAIRALPRADAVHIPIIAMTANALDEDYRNSREAGMDAHLAKPFQPSELYQILARQITEKREV